MQKLSVLALAITTSVLVSLIKIKGQLMTISGISMFLPLLGAFFALPSALGIGVTALAIKSIVGIGMITMTIPSMFGILGWSTHKSLSENSNTINHLKYFMIHAVAPALCMAIFIAQNNTSHAWVYSLYWLIPIALYAVRMITNRNAIFLVALSSTFVAHAVGSTMWAFAVPMTPEQWLALIPVVAVERIALAAGATIAYTVMCSALKYFNNHSFFKRLASDS